MPTNWKHAIKLSEIPDHGVVECVVDGRIVAISKVDGNVHALDGICPHQGGSLGKGSLHGCVVRCPWHGWEYDVTNGSTNLYLRFAYRLLKPESQPTTLRYGFHDPSPIIPQL